MKLTRLPHLLLLITAILPILNGQSLDPDPPGFLQPGTTYREYTLSHRTGDDWRVTDPGVSRADARIYLPNPVFTIQGVETSGVTRAEFMISHWRGHEGTSGQIINFNDAEPFPISLDNPYSERYRTYPLNMANPVFTLPLEYLREGENTYGGSIAEIRQGTHWWGQWGWYAFFLRTYKAPSTSATVARIANIASGDVITDNPEIVIEATHPEGISRIEVFAKYYGYDENGDYIFNDWHYFFHQTQGPEGHIATITQLNPGNTIHRIVWNTEWIPDQLPGEISIVARILDRDGNYTVTNAVTGLTLLREHSSVKMFTAGPIPLDLIRANQRAEITIRIPEDYPVESAVSASMPIRTWNGANNETGYTPLQINSSDTLAVIRGSNHYYKLESPGVDPALLRTGDNTLLLTSSTEHHGCEVLLPGPAFLLKWDRPLPQYLDGSRTPGRAGWYDGWFGHFYYTYKSRWVYSNTLGWLYWNPPKHIDQRQGWFYSAKLGWVFLSEDLLPLIYFFEIDEWWQLETLWGRLTPPALSLHK